MDMATTWSNDPLDKYSVFQDPDHIFHYSSLCHESKDLLDFNIPRDFSLHLKSSLSDRLFKNFNVTIPYGMSLGFCSSNAASLRNSPYSNPNADTNVNFFYHENPTIDDKKKGDSVDIFINGNGSDFKNYNIQNANLIPSSHLDSDLKPAITSSSSMDQKMGQIRSSEPKMRSNKSFSVAKTPVYIFSGSLSNDGVLKGLFFYKWNDFFQCSFSGNNRWPFSTRFITPSQSNKSNPLKTESSSSFIQLLLKYNKKQKKMGKIYGWFSECSYENSVDEGNPHWIGFRTVYHLIPYHYWPRLSLSLGGEVYYATREKNAGVSLGARGVFHPKGNLSLHKDSIATLTCNPIMGHLSASFVSPLGSFIKSACRLDFNIYSLESDISVAINIDKRITQIPFAPPDARLKMVMGTSNGVSFLYSFKVSQHCSVQYGLSWLNRNLTPTFGSRIEICT